MSQKRRRRKPPVSQAELDEIYASDGVGYQLVEHKNMVGVYIAVFVRSDAASAIRSIAKAGAARALSPPALPPRGGARVLPRRESRREVMTTSYTNHLSGRSAQ